MNNLASTPKLIENVIQNNYKGNNSNIIDINARKKNHLDDIKNKNEFYPTEIGQELIKVENKNGNKWAYVPEEDKFYFYDNKGFWKVQNVKYLMKLIRQILVASNPKWDKRNKKREVLSALKDLLMNKENYNKFTFSTNPNKELINLKNGMLDWRKDVLKEHNHEYYSQYQIPITYNPEANCTKWEKTMKEWIPAKETRMFLQEYVGYCLIPDTSMQIAVILTGSGSNGKSTFLDVLESLFGKNQLSNIPLNKLNNRFEVTYIKDKLVNICSDLNSNYISETGNIKRIIGGDTLRGEYKNGSGFDFKSFARMFFSANEIPLANDQTYGWYRRFEIIDFPNEFKKSDSNFDLYLKDKLKGELPGIFNWALKGLRRLKEKGEFTHSDQIKKAKKKYKKNNDSFEAFLDEMIELSADKFEVSHVVYDAYVKYCKDEGLKFTSRKKFTTKLKTLGIEVKNKHVNVKTERCYLGIGLLS